MGLLKMISPTEKIVFTNGCFDLFHIGHLYSLKFASTQGDILIVGINSDLSVKKIKGRKPIYNEDDRYKIVSSIKYVNLVMLYDEDTPYNLIEQINPDIIVKGPDYQGKEESVVGYDILKESNGKVITHSSPYSISTSDIIKKISSLYPKN